MWSPIVLCLFVGVTLASNPAWKHGAEYKYQLEGRTLANVDAISQQQSGILFKGTLRLQPLSEGKLRGIIEKPVYDEIHAELADGWQTEIPDKQVSWKQLKMVQTPFEVEMRNGRITGLIVSKSLANWEVNFIKSIMSQFQLNTKGEQLIDNPLNSLPEDGPNKQEAVFVAMEDTLTGKTETLYLIRPLPDQVVQRKSSEAKYLDAAENDDVIEIVKHKNYSNAEELPAYSYGFAKLRYGEPADNQMGDILTRDTYSRVIVTGSLDKFTIQKTFTIHKAFVSLTLSDNDKASVVSEVRATLEEIKSQEQTIDEVPQPVNVGNLVYSYGKPSALTGASASRRSSSNAHRYDQDDFRRNNIRDRRSLQFSSEESSIESAEESARDNMQEQPDLKEASPRPFLPYTVGYEGMSIKQKINVVQEVQKLAKEIAQRMKDDHRTHHEQVLGKFQTMVSLTRIMTYQELQQAAQNLYTNKRGSENAEWSVLRDAVAASGSGPALLLAKDLITSGKLSGQEASLFIATLTGAVREPTPEFLKVLFDIVKNPVVQKQWPLNNTALIGLTDIINRVYVDQEQSRNRFPTESFGSFETREGEQLIKNEVLPYLSKKLKEAVDNDETHQVHAYTRAIGNTGSYYFLKTFEPYLEGKQPASQFQRMLMILAMEKLAMSHPNTAQAVLFRVYQNPAESREVRMAAVFQIMRTGPSPQMLQAMAEYTNIDDDNYVNAAVVSAIRTASELEGEEYVEISKAAEAALELLDDTKTHGLRHGADYLRTYIVKELQKMYKESTQIFGSDDSMVPKGIRYSLQQHMGQIKRRIVNIQAMCSSMDDLLKVVNEQTADFQQQEKQQKQKSQEQEKNQWSSYNIAKLLNIQPDNREQLEAFIFMEMADQYLMTGLDNRTLERLPEAIREWEEELKKENEMNMYKLTTREMAVAFPTGLGLPFLFTYDVPMLAKLEGKLRATSNPQISQNGKINIPNQIDINVDAQVVISSKVQSRVSFVTPVHHLQNFAGFDKHWEFNLPVRAQVKFDFKNMNAQAEVELKADKEVPLFHYSTVPYTSKSDVTDFQPLSENHNTKIIRQDDLQSFESTFGKKTTGMAFRVGIQHKREFFNTLSLNRILSEQGPLDAMKSLWDDNSIQYSEINVNFRPEESATRKAMVKISYESKYRSPPDSDSASEWILNENAEPAQRQEGLMKKVAADIKNVQVVSLDATLEFQGQKKIKYILTGAVAKSNVDPKSRVMVSYKRKGDAKPHELHMEAKSYIPNTNALDLEFTLQNEPVANSEIKIKFGDSEKPLSKVELQVELRRTEERKHFLKQLPIYRQCKDEMRAGNKQLAACTNVTEAANLLDAVSVKLHHENLGEDMVEYIKSGFNVVRALSYPELYISQKNVDSSENEVKIQAQFYPDLQGVNVSIKAEGEQSIFTKIPVSELAQEILVAHPVFHLRSRLIKYAWEMDTYRPFCTIDKTHVNTFSNRTFQAEISKHWTVALQYLNGNSRLQQEKSIPEQLKQQPEHYVVLTRESSVSSNKKDVKIVLSAPETNFKTVEIDMTPAQSQGSGPRGKVSVNGQQVPISEKQSHDIEDGFVQMYSLPNGEIKVEVHGGDFYVIYDGNRVKMSATSDKLRNRIVGICGQFTEQESDDFLTPQACVAVDEEEFLRSLEVEGQEGKQLRDAFNGNSKKCLDREIPRFVNVINARDYRSQNSQPSKSTRCTHFQTQFHEEGDKICFTIHPQPTCSSHCQPRKQITKKVPVHCVQNGKAAKMWKQQIQNGQSPDFSDKSEHRAVSMKIPESCSQ
ncbi:vitellogenin [Diabrotica virgifera virgifera]|uniref:Vitellogenin-like n=1 Tax=Diabrotica virgifera virgifera TaxID=50390 RepID=A0A6P7FFC9_DIAVI|nr:vitellogenin [Diabrotica virgifera virgifera]